MKGILLKSKAVSEKPHYYIDFESNKAGDLFLLGLFADNKFSVSILDERLSALSSWPQYKEDFNIRMVQPKEFLSEILNQINKNSGIMIAYSEAEKHIFNEFLPNTELIDVPYLNLLKAAKRWKNKNHAQRFGKLGDFRKTEC